MPARKTAEFGAGGIFGAALYAAGVCMPPVIQAQMNFTDFHMLKTFLTASAASVLIYYIAGLYGYGSMEPRTPQYAGLFQYDGNIIGGVLMGIGMAISGACPGTVLVQVGLGSTPGLFVLLGGILGGMTFVASAPQRQRLVNMYPRTKSNAPATIHSAIGVSSTSVLVAWEGMVMLLLYVLSKLQPNNYTQLAGVVRPMTGGLLLGIAQATTLLSTKHMIGVSSVYEELGRWLSNSCRPKRFEMTSALAFGCGVAAGGGAIARLMSSTTYASIDLTSTNVSPSTAIIGGALIVFGARLAGGCTCGHGLSGMASFSLASIVTVTAMFGSGVLTAALMSS